MQKVAFLTLGCKVNQYESQSFRESVTVAGASESELQQADVVVINTCVVTHRAERESRSLIRRALRVSPETRVVVTGCLADKDDADLDGLERVQVVSNRSKNQVPFAVTGKAPSIAASSVTGLRVSQFQGRTRAFVKVQDGCALNCAFCIIPKVRGGLRSRRIADIQGEVEQLARNGHQEVVLTGVHLGHFGRAKGERERLSQLLAALAEVDGLERIRLSSIESVELRPDVLDVLCSSEKFVPHFHLPLQAGSDRILEAMRRRYTVAEFMTGIEELWRRFDRPSLSTDVIVGFPSETEEEFQQTLELMRQCGFGRSHIFSYSDREGTDSEGYEPKVPPAEIKRRANEAIRIGHRLARRYSLSFMNEAVPVLAESCSEEGEVFGYSDRYLQVRFQGHAELRGQILPVIIEEVDDEGQARGRLAESA